MELVQPHTRTHALFSRHIGLFCGDIGLFCDVVDWLAQSYSVFTSIFEFGIHIGVELQGGEHPSDVLSCRSLSVKEPLIIGLFGGK